MKKQLSGVIKEMGADKLVLLLLAGVLLMLSFGSDTGQSKEEAESTGQEIQSAGSYDEELESRLTRILEKAYGTGNICVMVTIEESENKVLATVDGECIFDGDSPYVIRDEAPKIRGVVVIVKSGNASGAALEITQVCEVLLGVSSNRVKVINKD